MLPIKSIMTKNVISVKPSTPIYEAMELLTKHKISGLPVVNDENRLVGILSEKDVLRILLNSDLQARNKVEHFMTKDVVSFTEDTGAVTICKFFLEKNIRRVPIVKDGILIGVVSRRDIIALILEAKSIMSQNRLT